MSRAEGLRGIEHEVGVLIRRVRRVIGDRARSVHPELQPASYLMLSYLAHDGAQRSSHLVDTFGIDKGAVSRQVQHLVDLGLLQRTPDPDDGRAMLVSATAEGIQRLEGVEAGRRAWLAEQLGDWSEEDLVGFADSLQRYNAALES